MTTSTPLTALPALYRAAGLVVLETPGWQTRGRPYDYGPWLGCLHHHTAGPITDRTLTPSLPVVLDGRSDLSPPLCNGYLGRDRKVYMIAAGYCLESETVVLTRRGLVPISTVRVGDEVWTHRSRWRPVTAVVVSERETVTVSGVGHPGIRCTPEHRWWVHAGWPRRSRRRITSELTPVATADLVDSLWVSPTCFEAADVPPFDGIAVTPEVMRVVGAWLADGHLDSGSRAVITARSGSKTARVEGWLDAAGLTWTRQADNQGTGRVRVSSAAFGSWLGEHFGRRSPDRTVPTWLLGAGAKYAEPLIEGFLHGDGYRVHQPNRVPRVSVSTTSRRLAFGMRMLANSLGLYALVHNRQEPYDITIKGRRTRATADTWQFSVYQERPHLGRAWLHDDRYVSRVTQVAVGRVETVYDITVADDHSFIADGLISHNSNHAGLGYLPICGTNGGNPRLMGWEIENNGIGESWDDLIPTLDVIFAVTNDYLGVPRTNVWGHKEYAPGRKTDPAPFDMAAERGRVAAWRFPQHEEDEMAFPYVYVPNDPRGRFALTPAPVHIKNEPHQRLLTEGKMLQPLRAISKSDLDALLEVES